MARLLTTWFGFGASIAQLASSDCSPVTVMPMPVEKLHGRYWVPNMTILPNEIGLVSYKFKIC